VLLGLVVQFGLFSSALAHVSSNGFLSTRIEGDHIEGALEIAVRDAELAVGVDSNHDGKISWGELRSAQPALVAYVGQHLQFSAAGKPCEMRFRPLQVTDRVDGHYVWLPFTSRCAAAIRELTIRYTLLEGIDPSHRGLLNLVAGGAAQTGVLGGPTPTVTYSVSTADRWRTFSQYLSAGVWHILSGIDHLLFLVSLLLPAVLVRRQDRWEPVQQARPALIDILKVVTAFTLAHSITLTLAALNIVRLPSRLTESVIAASIIVAALNNIFPVITHRRARIAFGFGLLHGFGFASVLADMGLPAGARLISLFSFNLGIETGQMLVVLAVMPVVYALRGGAFYRRAVMPWGSAAIAALAFVWLVQRAVMVGG
jgi:hypothetical protein